MLARDMCAQKVGYRCSMQSPGHRRSALGGRRGKGMRPGRGGLTSMQVSTQGRGGAEGMGTPQKRVRNKSKQKTTETKKKGYLHAQGCRQGVV